MPIISRARRGLKASPTRELARGAFDFGAGVDVRVWRFVALRGEARDLYTGSPGYNVAAISGGPVGFVATVKASLKSLGVRGEQILQERFAIAAPASMRDAALTFTVDFAKSRRKCEGSFAETLLMIAEKHGINVPNSCRVGKCGTCASAC
jgi:hypothetical protein